MKILLFLAFLATANAAVYTTGCGYSYSYFQRCNWYVPLPSSCWQFSVHYCQQWYTTKYYAPILKVYPNDKCGTAGWSEMTRDDFENDCAGKLEERRQLILDEIRAEYYKFLANLNATIASYEARQKEYVTKYYEDLIRFAVTTADKSRLIQERDEYIKKYRADLYQKANAVYQAYLKGIIARINSVGDFHKKILDASLKCFDTRNTKIAEYKKEIAARMFQYLVEYKKTMFALTRKRMDAYKACLIKIHGSETWAQDKVNAVVNYFWNKEYYKCIDSGTIYYRGLLDLKDKLITLYACSYRCTTYSGCLNFYRRSYYSSCKKMGAWWSYKITTPGCFRYVNYKFSWRTCTYKDLKTCSLYSGTLNKTKEQFRATIQPQLDAAIAAAKQALADWKTKWETLHTEYIRKYREIMIERHDFLLAAKKASLYCKYQVWTSYQEAEYESYHRELDSQLIAGYYKYIADLKESREKAIASFEKSITAYIARLNAFVDQVVARYQTCLDNRSKKVSEYYKNLLSMKNKLRENLVKRLADIVDLKVKYYTAMLNFYHCNYLGGAIGELLAMYKRKVEDESRAVLYEFDAFWRTQIVKLYYHYACGYKCSSTVKIAVPTFKCAINWRVCYPSMCSYTYKYTYYRKYCNYSLQYCNGVYVYCQ